MSALRLDLEAALSAAIMHELFQRVETFACLVAHLGAFMPARELDPARLATIRGWFVAKLVSEKLFSTDA